MIHRLLDVLVFQVEPDRLHLEQERELAVDADARSQHVPRTPQS